MAVKMRHEFFQTQEFKNWPDMKISEAKPHIKRFKNVCGFVGWIAKPSKDMFWPIGIGKTPKEAYDRLKQNIVEMVNM